MKSNGNVISSCIVCKIIIFKLLYLYLIYYISETAMLDLGRDYSCGRESAIASYWHNRPAACSLLHMESHFYYHERRPTVRQDPTRFTCLQPRKIVGTLRKRVEMWAEEESAVRFAYTLIQPWSLGLVCKCDAIFRPVSRVYNTFGLENPLRGPGPCRCVPCTCYVRVCAAL